jgi:hypothetical protein
MGRQPGTGGGGVQQKLRKGLWSPEEDEKLYNHIIRYGVGCWSSVPKLAGKHMRFMLFTSRTRIMLDLAYFTHDDVPRHTLCCVAN